MSDDLFSALNPIISDLVNPSVSQALALGKKGQSIPVRLPSGIVMLAKAGNEINSSQVVLGKDQNGGYLCYAGSSPKPTKKTVKPFKKRPENIKQVGTIKVLIIAQNKQDESKCDVYIAGDRSPMELIITLDDFDAIVYGWCGITSLGTGLEQWTISICQQFDDSFKITLITPENVTEYTDFSIPWYSFLEYKGNGVYSVPRMTTFHYKTGSPLVDRAKNVETVWNIAGFLFGYSLQASSMPIIDTFNNLIAGHLLVNTFPWENQVTFPLLSANLPSLSFADTSFLYSALKAGLNNVVGGDFFPTINNSFIFNDFFDVQTFALPSNYGYPSYTNTDYYSRLFEGGATASLSKLTRQPSLSFCSTNYQSAQIYMEDIIVFNNANIPPYPRLDSQNRWNLLVAQLETSLNFYHVNLAGSTNLSGQVSSKGTKVQKQLFLGYLRENHSTYLFTKPASNSLYESHQLLCSLPLTNTVSLASNVTQTINGGVSKLSGAYNEFLLAGNGCYLTERISLTESTYENKNETEWRIINEDGSDIVIKDIGELLETTSIKRLATSWYSPTQLTLCNNQSLTFVPTPPEQTTPSHPVSIFSLSGDKLVKTTKQLSVTMTYPDTERTYYRVSASYHP